MLSTKTSRDVEIMHGVSEYMRSCNCMENAIDIIDNSNNNNIHKHSLDI